MNRQLGGLVAGLVLLLAPMSGQAGGGDFCSGYEDGYKAGACYQKFGCIPPIPPICPIPRIGEDGYQDGYNRGFADGMH